MASKNFAERIALVEEPIFPHKTGRIRFGGSSWPAESIGCRSFWPNDQVCVVGRQGIVLWVDDLNLTSEQTKEQKDKLLEIKPVNYLSTRDAKIERSRHNLAVANKQLDLLVRLLRSTNCELGETKGNSSPGLDSELDHLSSLIARVTDYVELIYQDASLA
ncbi:MAG: hypothetical protein F6K30_20745, partial [Cyanothece sp. SIO2G6]|nr:hypothetical protein [Cyanothece sp. SIO2G6]